MRRPWLSAITVVRLNASSPIEHRSVRCAGGLCDDTDGTAVQVMPGPGKSFNQFQADDVACETYAADQVKGYADAANQRAIGAAVLPTALGAGGGALAGNAGGGAGVGAAIGLMGTVVGTTSNQAQYDSAFSQCMSAKGEQVPSYAL